VMLFFCLLPAVDLVACRLVSLKLKNYSLGKSISIYIKDLHLDRKYACAFLFNIIGSEQSEFEDRGM
jgi:hypothetical protein